MTSLMKSIEKDMHHYILALLLAIFIVSDMSVPKSIEEISHTLLGKVLIIGGALSLLFAHPLLHRLPVQEWEHTSLPYSSQMRTQI